MTASEIINRYISFFEKRGHKRIANSPLVPLNDPTTLFTSSGMQPLVPFLLGETHPQGNRLVNVQNCFRAQDIDEIGDNRHTTFFRMLGNWSLGEYFKEDQLPWFFEFLTNELNLDANKLFVTVFAGNDQVSKDTESIEIWKQLFAQKNIDAKEGERIFPYGVDKNWWSRAGVPKKMPAGEPGGPDSEVFYDFGAELNLHEKSQFKDQDCHPNCDCGRYMEIGNSVFMQYIKQEDGTFKNLPKQNVDFGGGLERLVAATENESDIFRTSLLMPIIISIMRLTNTTYEQHLREFRIITDHLVAGCMITAQNVYPSNKEQGYILRRLLRRSFDMLYTLNVSNLDPIIESIIQQYVSTDHYLAGKFEQIKNTILEEEQKYSRSRKEAQKFIQKKYKRQGDELMGTTEISADDAFILYTTHGLSPTQIKSLGFTFDEQAFARKMEEHQNLSRKGATQKFAGGLADHQERTIMGHTATHLLHQALRDVLGSHVHQTGSNITTERLRFDFNYEQKLNEEQIQKVEEIVNEKINANIPVHFEMIPTKEALEMGAIGLFEDTYQDTSKIYFIGGNGKNPKEAYSIEFCGGPHVDFTGSLKSFKIIKSESLGKNQQRVYAVVD